MSTESYAPDVAIVGLAGRFPGADTPEALWSNLRGGVESITRFGRERCESVPFDRHLRDDPNLIAAAGLVNDIEYFDGEFFGFTPREAALTDPQHRIFLECAWTALERAAIDPDRFDGAIGVYASTTMSRYLYRCLAANVVRAHGLDLIAMGNNVDFLTTLVSYKLNLTGPSYGVQTACSSSLVAVHAATQALRGFECDVALAGGVSIRVPQRAGYRYEEGSLFSPDEHCRPFDANARGTVFGNGAGVVVLQRLADALASGSPVLAVIKGTAVNNDGSRKAGFTAPSIQGQAAVIAAAHADAGVPVETIQYVEAHGTGTPVGDPIEVAALTDAFRRATSNRGFCVLGSVKSNLGHLDAAAGVVGLIKTVLMLQQREIPPTLHFRTPNPRIDFDSSPFYVNAELRSWQANHPRRAGVSSFGIGGTNAHVVLEEAPAVLPSSGARPAQLVTVSARTPAALDIAMEALVHRLRELEGEQLADAAYTSQVGRRAFAHRRALVCIHGGDAVDAWQRADDRFVATGEAQRHAPEVAFVFGGQGARLPRAVAALYAHEPEFRREFDRCLSILRACSAGVDWQSALFAGAGADALFSHTRVAQPTLFAVEYALARLWIGWGIEPRALVGHSLGEYVAACISSVGDLEDVLPLVVARGALMEEAPAGRMLAVFGAERDVLACAGSRIDLAAVNASDSCVLSGSPEAIDAAAVRLRGAGFSAVGLPVERAFHSRSMDEAAEKFLPLLERCRFERPRIPIVSTLTGTWMSDDEARSPLYWLRQLREPVRFAAALDALGPDRVLIELSATPLLRDRGRQVVNGFPDAAGAEQTSAELLAGLGRLWTLGAAVRWNSVYAGQRRRRVLLPTYPFQRRRHWIDESVNDIGRERQPDDSVKEPFERWFSVPSWKRVPPLAETPPPSASPSDWIVFADTYGLGRALARRLERAGHTVTCAEEGPQFAARYDGSYTIRPDEASDYARVLAAVDRRSAPLSIVHCWSVADICPAADEDAEIRRGCSSLIWLAQALDQRTTESDVNVYVVTSEAYNITGTENISTAAAMMAGPCKVVPQECPGINCRQIDLPRFHDRGRATWVEPVLAELLAGPGPWLVGYRCNSRWLPTLEPLAPESQGGSPPAPRAGGVYLVIGGLGRFGLIAAKYLARDPGARVVLTSRSALPDRSEWGEWLATHPPEDLTSRRIRGLQSVLACGVDPVLVQVDAADEAGMAALIRRIEGEYGAITGIIHAAGQSGANAHRGIRELTADEVARQFAPKVGGVRALADAIETSRPEFVLLTSSLSVVLGGLGLSAYAAAHHYIDAFAEQMQARGLPWTSVNWEAWAGDAGPRSHAGLGGELARVMLTEHEIEQCLEQVLRYRWLPRVVIATCDLDRRIRAWVRPDRDPARVVAASRPASTTEARAGVRHIASGDHQTTVQRILEVARSILGVADLGPEDNVFERGANSLSAIQMLSRLRREFEHPIPLAALFANPSAFGLARIIDGRPSSDEHFAGPCALADYPDHGDACETAAMAEARRSA
jgi:phthiocerol/phenolphthiocerol synthesis type-I polyketide synthase E